MSSPEYLELRGLSGNAVCRKAAYLEHPRKKSLLFWLQAMSLHEGGLRKLAREFIAAFADRIGTPTLLSHKLRDDKMCYPPAIARQIDKETGCDFDDLWETLGQTEAKRIAKQREHEQQIARRTRAEWLSMCRPSEDRVVRFFVELAINPKVEVTLPGEAEAQTAKERDNFKTAHEQLGDSDFNRAAISYFPDAVAALMDFQDAHAAKARSEFIETGIARTVFNTLDRALRRPGNVALIEGNAGVGKTEAAKTWVAQHLGEARLISLVGVSHKTGFFRTISKALGLASSYMRKSSEMQARVEDVLQTSKLMLVIDEAQFAFSSGDRIYTQPEICNWCYSALANFDVPLALIATEQFGRKLRQAEERTIWAGAPAFKRRLRPHVKLPPKPTVEEVLAIARKQMPGAPESAIKFIAGYAFSTLYPLTNLSDAILDAREIATEAGRSHITYEDAKRAVSEFRVPSDAASMAAFGTPQSGSKERQRRANAGPLQSQLNDVSGEDNLADQPAQNPRLQPAISGRTGRTLVTN